MSKRKLKLPYRYFVSYEYSKNEKEYKAFCVVPFPRKIKCMADITLLYEALKGAYEYDQIFIINFIKL